MRFILFFSMLVLSYSLVAQVKYPASEIPDSLLKNASAVYREYHSTFEVLDKGHAVQKEHVVVTLLNEKAEHLGTPFFQYFELVEIEDLEASVYDGDGHLVRNLKKKDIKDIKPFEEGVNDVRYKVLDLPSRSYPYTIAYKVTTKLNALMFYPSFSPQPSSDIAVQHAGFQIKMPSNLKVRIMELNLPEGSKKAELSWEFNNIPAFRPEPFAPQSEIKLPIVITSPTHFSMGGVDGDMTSWESYGVFMQQLLKSQSAIPAELENKLKNLVADCQTDICKVEKIYSYLQANTRYFYVGYGIGWWQPAPASKVDKYKYGDCKGLSNYMVSMLKAVGIESYYSIIKAGKNEQRQFPDFPNPHFNHVIVNVPLENDTIWLECTSQTESFGFLSDFTDNRPAFAITPEGGKLLRTPKYDETVNTIRRQTDIALQPDGNANLKSVDVFSGIAQNFLSVLEGYNDDLRKKHFYEVLKIGDFEITKLEFTRRRERIPAVVQNIELKLLGFAAANGKRLFIPLSPLTNKVELPSLTAGRNTAFQAHSRGVTEEDVVVYNLPAGYDVETTIQPYSQITPFGKFELSARQEGGKLLVTRKLVLNSSIHPKEAYPDYINFIKAIAKADKNKIVLKYVERP